MLDLIAETTTRVCIFCGASGVTAEHVWPRWVGRLLSDPGTGWVSVRATADGETVQRNAWPTATPKARARVVCAPCNHGWMSRIEGKVRPILQPMILGEARTLNAAEQLLIAAWTVKTAMVFEFVVGEEPAVFTAEDRAHMRQVQLPPSGARVRARAFAADSALDYRRYIAARDATGKALDHLAVCSTLAVGHVVLQVVYAPTEPVVGWDIEHVQAGGFFSLHPPVLAGAAFPNAVELRGEDFDRFAAEPFPDLAADKRIDWKNEIARAIAQREQDNEAH